MRGAKLVPDLPLYQAEADRAVRVFNRLRIPDIKDRPTFAEAGGEWFLDAVIRPLFGSYDETRDIRHIQEAFLLVPKKNAKSTGAAGVMLTWLIVNVIFNAEGLLIAPSKTIATEIFNAMKGMIRADEELDKKFHIQEHIRRINHRDSGAYVHVKAADTDAITGSKAHVTLIDEVHVFARHARAQEVFLELRGALTARPGGFLLMISTQSKTPPAGVFKEELNRARAVRDGKLALPVLAVLYELPKHLQEAPKPGQRPKWYDPALFGLVNPNMGRSVRPEFITRGLAEKEQLGPAELALFASQHLNIEIGVGLQTDGWAGAAHWVRRARSFTLPDLLDRCEVVTVGLDGGGLDDLYGFAAIGREKVTKRWLAWAHALISPEGMDRRRENAPIYNDFMEEGSLTLVDQLPDDLEWIKDHIGLIKDAGLLGKVGADPATIGGLVDTLAEIDVTPANDLLVGVYQGVRLMGAGKTLERKLVDGSFWHDGSAMMVWCVGNAKLRPTGTGMMVERAASGLGKIDPLMALWNAAYLMAQNPQPFAGGRSFWDSEENDDGD